MNFKDVTLEEALKAPRQVYQEHYIDILGESLSDVIAMLSQYEQDLTKEGTMLRFDASYNEDDCSPYITESRQETPEEIEKRWKADQDAKENYKKRRLNEYLRLKEEFEPKIEDVKDLI